MLIITNRLRKFTALVIVALLIFVQTSCAFAQSEADQAAPKAFTDLKTSHWGYQSIQKLVNLGGIKGYLQPDGTYTFVPEGTITYAELCSILLGANEVNTTISSGNWAQGVMKLAYSEKIVDQSIVPLADASKSVKRDVMSMILSLSAKELRGESLTTLSDIQAYVRDWSSISSAYQVYVNQAVAAGLIQGDTSSNFNASKNLTRAEASTIAMRLIDQSQRLTPEKFSTNTTSDGYKVIAEGTNISDYVKQPEWAKMLDHNSKYVVLSNGNKFDLTLVRKMSNWFMIQYKVPGKVIILDKDGNGLEISDPHTIGDVVKQPFGVDLSQVKYFVFSNTDNDTNWIVPNTLQ